MADPVRVDALRKISATLAQAKGENNTAVYFSRVGDSVRSMGGKSDVVALRNELQETASTLRQLRQRYLDEAASARSGDVMIGPYLEAARHANSMYMQNQRDLGKVRLLLESAFWKDASEMGLADVYLTTGKKSDAAIRNNLKPNHGEVADQESPSFLVKVKYDHNQLLQLLREGKIDEDTYFHATFARRVNPESGATALGSWWGDAQETSYSRTSVHQDVTSSPLASTKFEGQVGAGGGAWVRGIPPKNSWVLARLVQGQHSDAFEEPQKLLEKDPRAVQGSGNRIEYYLVPGHGSVPNTAGGGKRLVEALLDGRGSAEGFTSYTDPNQGMHILYGGRTGTPSMKWDDGSAAAKPVGKFIVDVAKDLRRARTFADVHLGIPPETRGKLTATEKQTADGKTEKVYTFVRDVETTLPHADPAEFKRSLREFRAMVGRMRDPATGPSAGFDRAIAAYARERDGAIARGDHAYAQNREKVRYQTVLDHARFQTELEQLETMLRRGEQMAHEMDAPSASPSTRPTALTKEPAASAVSGADLARLEEAFAANPGGHEKLQGPVADLIEHLNTNWRIQTDVAKSGFLKLKETPGKKYRFIIAGDGINGAYAAQKLLDAGVPKDQILIVGTMDSPFHKFMGIGTFETSNNSLAEMGVRIEDHQVNVREGGKPVPSTTAAVEAPLNVLMNSGINHVFGKVVPDLGSDGKWRFFVQDPSSGEKVEVQVGQRLLLGPGIPYPESVGAPAVNPQRVMTDVQFYQMAQARKLAGKPVIEPGKSVGIVGGGGASASVEKVLDQDALEQLRAGGTPGKITVFGNPDTYNNNRRFLLDLFRPTLQRYGLFEMSEGRVVTPFIAPDGQVKLGDVKELPDGRYEITRREGKVVVDYLIDAAASVRGKPINEALTLSFSPDGYKAVSVGRMDEGVDAVSAPITLIGPVAGQTAAHKPSVQQATSYAARGHETGDVTLPSGLNVDTGPFAYNAQVIRNIVDRLTRDRNPTTPKPN